MNKKILLSTLLLSSIITVPVYASEEVNKEKTASEIAFEKGLRLHLGLTPEEIKEFRTAKELQTEASLELPNAKIKSGTINISFTSTKPIPRLVLTPNYVGAIAFFDAAGEPWAISKALVGSSQDFEIIANAYNSEKDENGNINIPPDAHILYITAKQNYANSNLIVYLAEAKQPFIIPIESSSSQKANRSHDGLISYRVDSFSPFTKINPSFDSGTAINKNMLDILDGVHKGANPIKNTYNKEDVQIYELNNKYYIRTKHALIFPAPLSKVVVGDRKVYEINKINSIVVSINGSSQNIDLQD